MHPRVQPMPRGITRGRAAKFAGAKDTQQHTRVRGRTAYYIRKVKSPVSRYTFAARAEHDPMDAAADDSARGRRRRRRRESRLSKYSSGSAKPVFS